MSEPMSTPGEKAVAVLSDYSEFDHWWANLDGRKQTSLINIINAEVAATSSDSKYQVNEIVKYTEGGNWYYAVVLEVDYSDNPHGPVYKIRIISSGVERTVPEGLLAGYNDGMKTLIAETTVKPKYAPGNKILVEAEIVDVTNSATTRFDYEIKLDWIGAFEGRYFIFEKDILGKSEPKEPTKSGTVVVVAGHSWVKLGDETDEWYDAINDENRVWKELLIEGTPKVVWEPEDV